MAAGYHSPVAVSGSDGSLYGALKGKYHKRPSFLFLCTGILLYAPAAGSLLHGHVTAISKSVAEDWKPSSDRHNGACGLQVWKVAQLVEQWIFNLCVPGSIPGFPILLNGDHPKILFSNTL